MAKRPARKPVEKEIRPDAPPEGMPPLPAPVPMRSIVGQPRAIDILQGALASGRVHHAWIFHGPTGVGKFTAALSFAATLLDPTSKPRSGVVEPDPESHVQRLLAAGSHPDLHVITKELAKFSDDKTIRDSKQITIAKDVVEKHLLIPAALAPSVTHPPGSTRATKVFIVDEAELLDRSPTNAPTQNAILKTLEEPPEGTVIILVTASEDRLLPTIRSRCQRVGFGPLDQPAMDRWIKGAKLDLPAAQREWLAGYAMGSPGALLEAVEHQLFAWHQKLTPMLDQTLKGAFVLELGAALAELADAWAKAWVEKRPNASKDAANKDGADRVLRMAAEHFRRTARRLAPKPGARGQLLACLRAVDLIHEAERHLDANVNLALAMGHLAAQWHEAFAAAAAEPHAGHRT